MRRNLQRVEKEKWYRENSSILKFEKTLFDEIAKDFIIDFKVNQKKSLERAEIMVMHLQKFFQGYRAINITSQAVNR